MTIQKPSICHSRDELPEGVRVVEAYKSAVEELFFVDHPNLKKQMPQAKEQLEDFLKEQKVSEIWVYYPWRNTAVHTVAEEYYFKLRTARNRDLITAEEQEKYRNLNIAIAGLSVGASAVSALVSSGGPKAMRIADFDTLEISNLNRIRGTLPDVGMNKTDIMARNSWELDPFLEIELWDKGVTVENIRDFLLSGRKLDLFVEQVDNIGIKILARHICREARIPVLMATDNGDDILLDVERFDLEPEREIFHGRIGNVKPEDLTKLTFPEFIKMAMQIIGPEYHTPRLQESVLRLGKTIAGVPQLGTTAAVAGSVIAYATRRIANGQEMPSGKYWISLEEKLIPGYNSPEGIRRREEQTKIFVEQFNAMFQKKV